MSKKRPVIAKKMQTIFNHLKKSPTSLINTENSLKIKALERSPSQGSKVVKKLSENNSLVSGLLSKFFSNNNNLGIKVTAKKMNERRRVA